MLSPWGIIEMSKYRDPKRVVSAYFSNLGLLEDNAAALYTVLAKKVSVPPVKSLLLKIAVDGQKHSSLLKKLSEELMMPRVKHIENETEFGDAFKIVYIVQKDIELKEALDAVELLAVSAKLPILEQMLEEKYYAAHRRVIRVIERSTNKYQSASLDSFNSFFERAVHDEDEHQKLLSSVQCLVNVPEQVTTVEAEVKIEVNPLPLELPHEALLLERYIKKS